MLIPSDIFEALVDRFSSEELADFLRVPIKEFLYAAEENEWINEDNYDDLLEEAGLKVEEYE